MRWISARRSMRPRQFRGGGSMIPEPRSPGGWSISGSDHATLQSTRAPAGTAQIVLRREAMATATALHPGKLSETASFRPRYGNYIGGRWVEPVSGRYFENITPVTGRAFCEIPRSNAQDIDRALDAAHAARAAWGRTSAAQRANIMLQI